MSLTHDQKAKLTQAIKDWAQAVKAMDDACDLEKELTSRLAEAREARIVAEDTVSEMDDAFQFIVQQIDDSPENESEVSDIIKPFAGDVVIRFVKGEA